MPADLGHVKILVGRSELAWFEKGDYEVTEKGRVTFLNGRAVSLDLRAATVDQAVDLMGRHPTATASLRVSVPLLLHEKVLEKLSFIGTRWLWIRIPEEDPAVDALRRSLSTLSIEELFIEISGADRETITDLSMMTSLRGLGLRNTTVSSGDLEQLRNASKLRWLDLREATIKDGALDELQKMGEDVVIPGDQKVPTRPRPTESAVPTGETEKPIF